jgi:hypothetical protein
MPLSLPSYPKDGLEIKVGNRTLRWNKNKNRWEMV